MEILNQLLSLVKLLGRDVMLELVKSRWIRFAVGFVLVCFGISLIKWW